MMSWWDHAAAMHKQVLDAQQASLKAGNALLRSQAQAHKVIEANQRAVGQWARLWGIK